MDWTRFLVPVGIGLGVAGLTWVLTRPSTAPATGPSGARMRGYTQGSGYGRPGVRAPLISSGMQRLYVNRPAGSW